MAEKKHLAEKYKALTYGNEQFDKNVLFIASGALGISFGFIEKLVPDLSATVHKCYLIDAWYCFAGVIFISLLAHFISMMANRWAIVNDDAPTDKYKKISCIWNYSIRGLNILMIAGLLIGILLLVSFVKHNL